MRMMMMVMMVVMMTMMMKPKQKQPNLVSSSPIASLHAKQDRTKQKRLKPEFAFVDDGSDGNRWRMMMMKMMMKMVMMFW